MFIIKPKPINKAEHQYGVGIGQWIKTQLAYLFIGNNYHLHNTHATHPTESFGPDSPKKMGLFQQALLMTFPWHGFDISTHTITDFNGKVRPYDGSGSFYSLILTTIFGLPNRPLFDKQNKPRLNYGLIILFNFFGGFDLDEGSSFEKNVWQFVSLIFKVLVIFPFNVLMLLPKIALNLVKIFTELLPTIAAFLCASAYRKLFYYREKNGLSSNDNFLISFATFLMVIVSFLHFVTKTLSLLGRALTAPENSAKLAATFAHEIKGRIFGINAGTVLGFIAGTFSVALSATLWAIALPLSFSAGLKYFPSVMTSLYQAVIWLTNIPMIAHSLNLLNSVFVPVITGLNAIIAPIVIPVANFLSLQITATMFYIGTAIGLLAFPLTLLSRVVDDLSNAWVKWHKSGPFTALLFSSSRQLQITVIEKQNKSKPRQNNDVIFSSTPDDSSRSEKSPSKLLTTPPPSGKTIEMVERGKGNFGTATQASTASFTSIAPESFQQRVPAVKENHWAVQLFRGVNREPSQLDYSTWYSADLIPVLMRAGFNDNPALPILYFAPTQDRKLARIPYRDHVANLAKYAKQENKVAIMISNEPGAGKNYFDHFIVTLVTPDGELFYCNLTTSKHKDPYAILSQLKKDHHITSYSVYQSKTPLQHDTGPVVSCGPLCVELARNLAKNAPHMIAEIKKQRTQNDDHYEFDLMGIIDPELANCALLEGNDYKRKIMEIRARHYQLLGQINDVQVQSYAEQDTIKSLLDAVLGLPPVEDDFDLDVANNSEEADSANDSGDELFLK